MIDEQLQAATVGIIVLIAVFNVSGYYLANRNVEPFSELGILGPNQKIADYPTHALVGQNFTLYLYVGNHEGHVMYYQVLAKVGDRASVINENVSLAAPPVATYSTILRDNQTYLNQITLSLNHNGTNVRLVFELWVYRTNTTSFAYDHRFVQLWLNVTGPSI
ncbi:MAG: DUF1616 domain-containing protein [Thaumarchaeota archaeon]|nr:DUF1616 domain-containing protein [Nitrososphaerota archaeon]